MWRALWIEKKRVLPRIFRVTVRLVSNISPYTAVITYSWSRSEQRMNSSLLMLRYMKFYFLRIVLHSLVFQNINSATSNRFFWRLFTHTHTHTHTHTNTYISCAVHSTGPKFNPGNNIMWKNTSDYIRLQNYEIYSTVWEERYRLVNDTFRTHLYFVCKYRNVTKHSLHIADNWTVNSLEHLEIPQQNKRNVYTRCKWCRLKPSDSILQTCESAW